MRNKWIKLGVVTLVMCAAVITATTLAVRMSRTVPLDECSELYRRYCDVPGIRAAFIKDKKINDTVFVDVTLLQAMDDSAWCVLQKDFNLPAIIIRCFFISIIKPSLNVCVGVTLISYHTNRNKNVTNTLCATPYTTAVRHFAVGLRKKV